MIQVRHKPTSDKWIDYGTNIGFIAAAKKHAPRIGLVIGCIEVRDSDDPSIPIAKFELRRRTTYEVLNPRQGAE